MGKLKASITVPNAASENTSFGVPQRAMRKPVGLIAQTIAGKAMAYTRAQSPNPFFVWENGGHISTLASGQKELQI